MGCETEKSITRLPLFSPVPVPAIRKIQMQSPETTRNGMVTPPLQQSSAVSVPFRWEQEPGKPRLCSALITFSNPTDKSLELPPRMLVFSPASTNYVSSLNRFKSPSFRIGNRYNCYGSSSDGGGGGSNSNRGLLGAMVLIKGAGWFGSWRKKAFKVKREVTVMGGSHVFPSSRETGSSTIADTHTQMMKHSAAGSSSSRGKSRFWTTIREGMKQVVPWRRKKLKKDGSGLRL